MKLLLTAGSVKCIANVARIADITVFTRRMVSTRFALTYITHNPTYIQPPYIEQVADLHTCNNLTYIYCDTTHLTLTYTAVTGMRKLLKKKNKTSQCSAKGPTKFIYDKLLTVVTSSSKWISSI